MHAMTGLVPIMDVGLPGLAAGGHRRAFAGSLDSPDARADFEDCRDCGPGTAGEEDAVAYDKSKGKLHEADHSHRHEKDFRLSARRNKLLGLWVAGLMKLEGAEAETYAKQVVSADLEEPGDEDVIRKVMGDLDRQGVPVSREQLRKKMDELIAEARHQLGH